MGKLAKSLLQPNTSESERDYSRENSSCWCSARKGVSAITIAAKAIAKMPLGRIDSETTANIGRFEGGTQTNIVCDHVQIFAEARSLINEKWKYKLRK